MSDTTVFGKVDSVDFAIYLNKKANEKDLPINVTKIQKWLYICYGLFLAAYDEQLLDERPKAWNYGPAFPKVHKKQKNNQDSLDGLEKELDLEKFSAYDDVIDAVLRTFGRWTASELVAWTHERGTAWDKVFRSSEMYTPISNEDIKSDFVKLLQNG